MILFPLSAILLITTSSDSVIVPTTLVPSEYLKPVNAILELSEFAERLCISIMKLEIAIPDNLSLLFLRTWYCLEYTMLCLYEYFRYSHTCPV